MKLEKIAAYVGIAGGAYLLFKLLNLGSAVGSAASAVGNALTSTGESIGGALFDWIHPKAAGESLYFTTQFLDGSKHAIPSLSVDIFGRFTYNGVRYLMMSSATVPHIAVPV